MPGDFKDLPVKITTKDPQDDFSTEQTEQITEAKDSAGDISHPNISFSTSECLTEEKITYIGHNIHIGGKKGTKVENQEACAKLSFLTKGAKFWSYVPDKKLCHVKYSKSGRKPHTDVVSGNRECGKAGNQFSTLNCAVLLFFCFHSLLLFIRNSLFAYLTIVVSLQTGPSLEHC